MHSSTIADGVRGDARFGCQVDAYGNQDPAPCPRPGFRRSRHAGALAVDALGTGGAAPGQNNNTWIGLFPCGQPRPEVTVTDASGSASDCATFVCSYGPWP